MWKHPSYLEHWWTSMVYLLIPLISQGNKCKGCIVCTSGCAGESASMSPPGQLRAEKGHQGHLCMTPAEVPGGVVVGWAVGEQPSHDCNTDQSMDLPWNSWKYILPTNGVHHNDSTYSSSVPSGVADRSHHFQPHMVEGKHSHQMLLSSAMVHVASHGAHSEQVEVCVEERADLEGHHHQDYQDQHLTKETLVIKSHKSTMFQVSPNRNPGSLSSIQSWSGWGMNGLFGNYGRGM